MKFILALIFCSMPVFADDVVRVQYPTEPAPSYVPYLFSSNADGVCQRLGFDSAVPGSKVKRMDTRPFLSMDIPYEHKERGLIVDGDAVVIEERKGTTLKSITCIKNH